MEARLTIPVKTPVDGVDFGRFKDFFERMKGPLYSFPLVVDGRVIMVRFKQSCIDELQPGQVIELLEVK